MAAVKVSTFAPLIERDAVEVPATAELTAQGEERADRIAELDPLDQSIMSVPCCVLYRNGPSVMLLAQTQSSARNIVSGSVTKCVRSGLS